jgi:cell division protein FtsB
MRWLLLLLLILLAGLQYRLWIGQGSWAEIVALERALEEQEVINERLRQRNKVLEIEVRALKNGTDSVEERARSELGLIKEDETFFLIIDKDNNDASNR